MEIDKEKCLICSGEMRIINPPDNGCVVCINGCTAYLFGSKTNTVIFVSLRFDNRKKDDNYSYTIPDEVEHLQRRVNYWKENDRYLLEILGRS